MVLYLSNYEVGLSIKNLDGTAFQVKDKRSRLCLYNNKTSGAKDKVVRVTPSDTRDIWTVSTELGVFYLAGPMRGYPLFNFPAFLMATRILQTRGFSILSPAEKDIEAGFDPSRPIEEQGFDMNEAFKWDFEAVCRSKGTILLPGWERSTGAKAERVVAQLCGKEVYLLDTNYNLTVAPATDYNLEWLVPMPIMKPERKCFVDPTPVNGDE